MSSGPTSVSERGPLNAAMLTVRSCRAITARASSSSSRPRACVPPLAAHSSMNRPAKHDDPRRFLEAENAGHARRRDFADAVADDRGRFDAPRFPKRGERHLHGEDGRLRDLGAMHLRSRLRPRRVPRAARSASTAASPASQRSIISRNTGSCCISSRPMPHHCGPWPLITKATRGAICSGRGVKRCATLRTCLAGRERAEFAASASAIERGDQRQPVRMVIAPRSERVTQVRQQRRTAVRISSDLRATRSARRRRPRSASSERAESTIGQARSRIGIRSCAAARARALRRE